MQVASIVPEQFLHLTVNETFFMALAHLVRDGDNAYSKFFKDQSLAGKYILMDNGAAEEAQLPSMQDLLDKAALIGATEIVLPDHLMNKDETLAKTQAALRYLIETEQIDHYKWMAVPQGRDLGNWEYCLRNLLTLPGAEYIDSIGISKFLSLNIDPNARLEAMRIAVEVLKEHNRNDIEIHLLGCAYTPLEVNALYRMYGDRIRSVDSAIPYVFAQKGLEMIPENDRPQFEIQFLALHLIDEGLLQDNIDRWRNVTDVGGIVNG